MAERWISDSIVAVAVVTAALAFPTVTACLGRMVRNDSSSARSTNHNPTNMNNDSSSQERHSHKNNDASVCDLKASGPPGNWPQGKGTHTPFELSARFFFDFKAHPFRHSELFKNDGNVLDALVALPGYLTVQLQLLYLPVADILRCTPGAQSPANSFQYRLQAAIDRLSSVSKVAALGNSAVSQADTLWNADAIFRGAAGDAVTRVGTCQVFVEPGGKFWPDHVIGVEGEAAHAGLIYICRNARVIGGILDVSKGDILIGAGTHTEGSTIHGPTIIGRACQLRKGAFLRGNCITGDDCVLGGEIKASILMDSAMFPHPSYVGDSICGFGSHFGNQATSANVSIFSGLDGSTPDLSILIRGRRFDSHRQKLGIIMGDFCQVGCNTVTDPGTLLGPSTVVYPLSRIPAGVYGPRELIKNKPLKHGVLERYPSGVSSEPRQMTCPLLRHV